MVGHRYQILILWQLQCSAVTWLLVFHAAACTDDESSVITLYCMSSASCLHLMEVPIVRVSM